MLGVSSQEESREETARGNDGDTANSWLLTELQIFIHIYLLVAS